MSQTLQHAFKKVIMNLNSSKASGPDCIPMVVLKDCEPEFSYILASTHTSFNTYYLQELFNMCLKKSIFSNF